jgi:hypothetical protein
MGGAPVVTAQLLFGRPRPDGGTVNEPEWQDSVAEIVTPRCPDGLTVLQGSGQWRSPVTGRIAAEPSTVVPPTTDLALRLPKVRDAYRTRFAQESVGLVTWTKLAQDWGSGRDRTVSSARPTASRLRQISTLMSVSALATALKTWRPPDFVSTLPTLTSKCRSPSSQRRMKVESKVTTIAGAAISGLAMASFRSASPIFSVRRRKVSESFPASTGSICASTSAATQQVIRAERCA